MMSKRKSTTVSDKPHKRAKALEEEEVDDANVYDSEQDEQGDQLLGKQVCTVTAYKQVRVPTEKIHLKLLKSYMWSCIGEKK